MSSVKWLLQARFSWRDCSDTSVSSSVISTDLLSQNDLQTLQLTLSPCFVAGSVFLHLQNTLKNVSFVLYQEKKCLCKNNNYQSYTACMKVWHLCVWLMFSSISIYVFVLFIFHYLGRGGVFLAIIRKGSATLPATNFGPLAPPCGS